MTFDSCKGKLFVVYEGDGSDLVFVESNCRLHIVYLFECFYFFNLIAGIVNNNYALGAFMQAALNDTVHLKWKEDWWSCL